MLENVGSSLVAEISEEPTIVDVCIRCRSKSEGSEQFAGFICDACHEEDGDITGESN